jgi:copper chaperone NosL
MTSGARLGVTLGVALASVVAGVVFLWPGSATGPEPIAYGRDTCASCRMHLSQPGFAGEMRDPDGTLTKYDDVGCLIRAILAARREVPEAWVEDHAGGGFVPLLSAKLVRGDAASTPMGSGLVAFADDSAAIVYAEAHGARVMAFEDVLRDSTLLALLIARPPSGAGRAP